MSWKLDNAHTSIEFSARHMMVSTVRGNFTEFSGEIELDPDDVQLRVRGQQGFAVSREGGEVVALDLTLDDGLRHRGLSREVVRLVQDLRKNSGLDVSDRIHLQLEGLDMIREHFDYIAREVLAVSIESGSGDGEGTVLELETDEGAFTARAWLRKADGPR